MSKRDVLLAILNFSKLKSLGNNAKIRSSTKIYTYMVFEYHIGCFIRIPCFFLIQSQRFRLSWTGTIPPPCWGTPPQGSPSPASPQTGAPPPWPRRSSPSLKPPLPLTVTANSLVTQTTRTNIQVNKISNIQVIGIKPPTHLTFQ